MSSNNATIDVSGPAARTVAKSVISTLGVEVDQVDSIQVTLVTGNGDETTTEFSCDGPQAGPIASEMIGALSHDERPPKRIEVSLAAGGSGNASEAGEDDEPATEPGPEDEDEPEAEGTPDEPAMLSHGSNGHLALTAVAAYYTMVTKEGDGDADGSSGGGGSSGKGVTAAQLLRNFDLPVGKHDLVAALERSASVNGVLVKYQRTTSGAGRVNGYTLSDRGVAYLADEGGHPDLDLDISGATNAPTPDPAAGSDAHREAMQGRELCDDITREGAGRVKGEPDVDGPKPINPGTRFHEALWTLRQKEAEEGEGVALSSREVAEVPQFDFPNTRSASAALSKLFTNHALVERSVEGGGRGGLVAQYRLTDAGRAEVERHPHPDDAR